MRKPIYFLAMHAIGHPLPTLASAGLLLAGLLLRVRAR
jgi:hypothetical protein